MPAPCSGGMRGCVSQKPGGRVSEKPTRELGERAITVQHCREHSRGESKYFWERIQVAGKGNESAQIRHREDLDEFILLPAMARVQCSMRYIPKLISTQALSEKNQFAAAQAVKATPVRSRRWPGRTPHGWLR